MRFFYFILLIISIVFYVCYQDTLSFITLLTLLILMFFLFTSAIILTRNVRIEFENETNVCSRNDSASINLKIANKCFLPACNIKLKIKYITKFDGKARFQDINMPLPAYSEQMISLNLNYSHCDKVKISVVKYTVFDLLKLFRFSRKSDVTSQIVLMPVALPAYGYIENSCLTDIETNTYYPNKTGNDCSEIFDLREFRDGDSQNRVHWKLSSKKDELIVKEFSANSINSILIICEVFECKNIVLYDRTLDILLSVGNLASENNSGFYIMNSNERNENMFDLIANKDELSDKIFSIIAENTKHSYIDNFISINIPPNSYSHIVYISPEWSFGRFAQFREIYNGTITFVQPYLNSEKVQTTLVLSTGIDEYIPIDANSGCSLNIIL